jgi:hypothetical protein
VRDTGERWPLPGTTEPNNFLYTPRPDLTGVGVLLFAASWLLVIGLLNLFYAISVIAGSEIFITTAGWLVGDARPWGWLMLIVALVQLVAAGGIFAGRRWALWIAVVSVFGHIVAAIMFLSDSTLLGVLLLGLDVTVLGSLAILMEERAAG